MSSTSTQTAWPEGVIARYITIAGQSLGNPELAVQITTPNDDVYAYATCSGCPARDTSDLVSADCLGGPDHARQANARYARQWAQAHAEKCRAMPRPTA
ncbi:hypothetical protein [Streptomyces scopuliridis]|uniref:hypothetical protein n=1 Tax=Streptomyces scopuliridis TaxID=452529 RepID=UPI0036A56908